MKKLISLLLLITSFTSHIFAQTEDNEAWATASASFDIVKKLDFNTSFSSRFNNNLTNLNSYNIEAGLSYKLSKKWKTTLNYRFTNKFNTYSNRINIDFKWEDKIYRRLYLTLRPRLQKDIDLNKERTENTIRTKIDLSYKIKKTQLYPSIYTEIFYGLNQNNQEFNKIRIGGSIDIKSLKNQKLSIGYFKI